MPVTLLPRLDRQVVPLPPVQPIPQGSGRPEAPAAGTSRPRPHPQSSSRNSAADQRQRGRRGDRLGQRGDPEDRVASQRRVADERGRADRVDVQLVAVGDERDQSRQVAGRDVRRHRVVQQREAVAREHSGRG
jgi:hypothetical protein